MRAPSEQRARKIVKDHFIPFHLDQTQKGDETLFVEQEISSQVHKLKDNLKIDLEQGRAHRFSY